ncbi:acyltransferase family protein [Aliikangiella coralliicola]|uniref:Acyltransferase n=1 Tax=Aliikangiella coralliicola TaxID=2592383 RepID=A0A545UES5_9GAMM|nr:acyltransferase [Aliikangiella coralliicola]TQV87980.1 acyltransferase [Aliikangiella coralliicola]
MEIRKLNMLRGLAAMIVLITHFSDATGWLDTRLGGRAGQYGVMLFFMLSGFLMSYLYLDKAFSRKNIKQYILARSGRVLPLYLLVVFVSYLSNYLGHEVLYEISDWQKLISHLIFLDGESVLWTIAPEIHFYAIFLVFWYLGAWRPGYTYVVVIASLILLFLTNFPRPHGDFHGLHYDFHLFRSLPYFFIGVLLGMHYKSLKVPEYLRKNWFILALVLIPILYPQFSPVTSDAKHRMWLSYEVLFVMSTVFFCILFLVPDNNVLLSNRLGDFLGKISFSLYLLHMPLLPLVNKLNVPIELKLVVFVLVSLLVAYVSYRFIEKPSAKFVRGLSFKTVGWVDEGNPTTKLEVKTKS